MVLIGTNDNRMKSTALGTDVTNYTYDAANQLRTMGPPPSGPYTTFTYDSLHQLSQKILPNGTKTTPAYDSLSELMSLAHTTSTSRPLLSTSYTYDVLGNRLTRTDSPSLTPPPATTDPNAWGYDVANRLLTRPGVTYTYDNNGNTLTKTDFTGTTTYGYDYENRLASVSAPGGITASYAYDPFGRRINKTVNGVTTNYLYDGMNIIKEYDGTGTLLATYVHGPGIDQPISMTRGGQTYYYHADGLGSTTGLTDSSQAVVQMYGYDGFGNLDQTPTVQNPYTYTGREWDPETGLYYYRARYYDPKVGRFLQQDPIGLRGGINLYGYVRNNAVNWVDPSGLQPIGPPPVPVPGGGPGSGWKWNPDPNNSRGGTWGPQRPIPGQSQPSASWDPEGHWDIDTGFGERQRCDQRGRPMTPEEAHRPPWWQGIPLDFEPLPLFLLPGLQCAFDPSAPGCPGSGA